MDKFLGKIADFLTKIFDKNWVILTTALVGVLLVFVIGLLLAILTGDFIRCKKACKMISQGEVEAGIAKMKKHSPAFDKKLEIAPPVSNFEFDKIVTYPFSYSLIRILSCVVLAAAAFFTVFAWALWTLLPLNNFLAVYLIAVPMLGLILCVVSMLVSSKQLKGASRNFYAMIETLKEVTVIPASPVPEPHESERSADAAQPEPAPKINPEELYGTVSPSVDSLLKKVRQIAVEGGGDRDLFKDLFRRLKEEREKPQNQNPANQERLGETADLLNLLLDTM